MQRLLFYCFCFCWLSSCVNEEPSITEEEALSLTNGFFEALSKGDTLYMQNHITADFLMFEHEQVWNMDSLLRLMPLTQGRVWEINEPTFNTSGNLAHLSYFNQGIIPSDRSWLESVLMKREGKHLKMKFMHSTKLYE